MFSQFLKLSETVLLALTVQSAEGAGRNFLFMMI
jgi:tRNA(Met) C34 N-acetyltransferase TmcA